MNERSAGRRHSAIGHHGAHDNARYVNPLIGVAGGNVIPGAVLPHGLASVSPYSVRGCYGLRAGGAIHGFGHHQFSSIGCAGLGGVVTMPAMGPVCTDRNDYASPGADEAAEPGYYAVRLKRFGIRAEMSATMRTGISRYTFPAGEAHVLLDLGARGDASAPGGQEAACRKVSAGEVEGWIVDGNFGQSRTYYKVFFIMRVVARGTHVRLWRGGELLPEDAGSARASDRMGACFCFATDNAEAVVVQAGLSLTSIENARLNLDTEQSSVDFCGVRKRAYETWKTTLARIGVDGGEPSDRVKFYTGLYHALILPQAINDVNGEYRSMPNVAGTGAVRTVRGRDRYRLFSLWDTYRSLHPFLTLVYPGLQRDCIRCMVDMYREGGWLPKWELAGMETGIMVGDPALVVIADTYLKGITDFDVQAAYRAMIHNADALAEGGYSPVREGLRQYLEYGYLPQDYPYPNPGGTLQTRVRGPVSITMESAYADWCLARLAEALGHERDRERFAARGDFYRNVFDVSTGFFRPRNRDGSWFSPFDPESRSGGLYPGSSPGFVEGSAWDYRFFPPHGMEWIVRHMGGERRFVENLRDGFDRDLYRLDNEPALAFPYLFNHVAGQEWRTQKEVRRIVDTQYRDDRAGLPGDDDAGTLSAWLAFSMMGLYPDCPGKPRYQIAAPCFDTIVIDPGGTGKPFTIRAENNTPGNVRIESMTMNGKPHGCYRVDHDEIAQGGELKIVLRP